MKLLLASHLLCTIGMFGVIWIVQVVHYPLFEYVDRPRYQAFQQAHESRISFVVLPLMMGELATAVLLVATSWNRADAGIWIAGFGLIVLIWASTFLVSVPEHARLGDGFDGSAHRRLVTTNWIRTIAWAIRAGLVLYGTFATFESTARTLDTAS